jgi:ADP-ribose pyrophosphatase YjhB (NUDIX family)
MSYHHCKLIASGAARLHGDLLLVQQSYPGDPRPYWGLPGGQVEPGEELLAGLQRELLEETGLNLVGTPTIAFVLQVLRETEEGIQEWLACHFARRQWLARSAHKILMAWSSQPIGWRSKQPWSTWGRTPDTIVNHCAAGSVEKQHREQFIPSRSNKAGVHFGKILLAFSPQRKQASSNPPKWP